MLIIKEIIWELEEAQNRRKLNIININFRRISLVVTIPKIFWGIPEIKICSKTYIKTETRNKYNFCIYRLLIEVEKVRIKIGGNIDEDT